MIEVVPTDIAHGGEAVGRVDGKAHFVAGAMPGERVRGEVERSKKHWARVRLREVVEASPERVEPPCPHFDECGGCQWQYAAYPAQLRWKQSIVAGQLAHLGRIDDPPVAETVAAGPAYGYRNRMDFSVHRGAPALHRRRSGRLVPLDTCLLLHPGLVEVFDRLGDLSGATSVTLRLAVSSGERMAVVSGAVPEGAETWGCSVVLAAGGERHEVIGRSAITEVVAGVPLRITADAFFQNSTAGAEVLVELVDDAIDVG
ncbi:MAG: hypothetical protein R3290_12140, partial [Acidimicrobiia bacterium]|nr:hypothetical protein [Acidimicrobiia bacterium]